MFLLAAAIFSLFTIIYALLSGAIIYHFRKFSLPGAAFPRHIVRVFIAASVALWGIAAYFLMQLSKFYA